MTSTKEIAEKKGIKEAGATIKKLRTERGITQRGLADMVGTSREIIQRWENGRGRPSDRFLPALADALRCDVRDIWSPPIKYWLRGYDEEKIARAGEAAPLLKRRLELEMSQVELARKSGVGLKTIRDIEAGYHAPTWETRKKLRAALGMSEERYYSIEDRNKMVLHMQNILQWVITDYNSAILRLGMDYQDVLQELNLCAIRAIDRFYPRDGGASVETYVIRNLMGRMKNLIHKHNAGGMVGGAAKNSNVPLVVSLEQLMEQGARSVEQREAS